MFSSHFFVLFANPPLSCSTLFLTTMIHLLGGAGPVGYCRSGGLWQAQTSLLSRHWRHPHVLLHRQPRQLRWEQRTHLHVAQLLHVLQSYCVISGCFFIVALLEMHEIITNHLNSDEFVKSFLTCCFFFVFFFFVDARCESRLNDSRRSALTYLLGFTPSQKTFQRSGPLRWNTSAPLFPSSWWETRRTCAMMSTHAESWPRWSRCGQSFASFFRRLALSHEKVNPRAF